VNNLIKEIQARHDTDKPYVVSMSSKDVQMHKDRGHLLEVIKQIGGLETYTVLAIESGRQVIFLSDIEALLNGDPK